MNEIMCPVCDFDCPYLMVDGTCQLGADAYFECDEMWPFLDDEDEPIVEADGNVALLIISYKND